ncbi:MAG: DEAD/DEAH box helicase, partial [Desulforhopalus sp.]
MFSENSVPSPFSKLGLGKELLKALTAQGYEAPTQIQVEIIPPVLAGRDVVGQAQTGTGKTAAFALPLLSRLDLKSSKPQVLVLAPTRELAIQVAESFKNYGQCLKKLNVLPIFGGQDYAIQLKQLRKGAQIIVGTPGRVMDHVRRGSLKLETISNFVLDEADEMLNMGFLEDVEWLLERIPEQRQIALFSATMPASIRRIARKYLQDPMEITIKGRTATAHSINQRYLVTDGYGRKLEALRRLLEVDNVDGMLVFVRTKIQTVELAEQLSALGHSCAPLNGDIPQNQRQRTVDQLKSKKIDILVATDVAARGLDVDRISHVVNFDIPFDTEAYIHRIGRTGRAGRSGEAILFVHPREKKALYGIEKVTRQKITEMALPTVKVINIKRTEGFKRRITDTLLEADLDFYLKLIADYRKTYDVDDDLLTAALAHMVHGETPFLFEEKQEKSRQNRMQSARERSPRKYEKKNGSKKRTSSAPDKGMERYRIEIGKLHGVKPSNIVGAIANEADISSKFIGRITINEDHSTVDLPYSMPTDTFQLLKRV